MKLPKNQKLVKALRRNIQEQKLRGNESVSKPLRGLRWVLLRGGNIDKHHTACENDRVYLVLSYFNLVEEKYKSSA